MQFVSVTMSQYATTEVAVSHIPQFIHVLSILLHIEYTPLFPGQMYQFAKAAVTKHHKLGGLNNRHLLSHSSGSQGQGVSGVIVPPEGCEGKNCSRCISLACRRSLSYPQNLFLDEHKPRFSSTAPFGKHTPEFGLGTHSTSAGPHPS